MSETIPDVKRPMKKKTRKRKSLFSVKKAKCSICSMVLKSIAIRDKHLLTHSDDKEFSCEICSKQFRRKDQMKLHVTTHFKGYGLSKQDFISFPLNALSIQYKPIIKMKDFVCTTCSKICSSNGHLRSHMITHSNFRPFCCEICAKAFKRSDGLRNHFKIYHPEYRQNYMDYAYIEAMNVANVGKNFQCDICSKVFGTKDSVKFHLFSHFDLKPHECQVCSRGFRNKAQLRKHLRTHGGSDRTATVCRQETELIKTVGIRPCKVVLRASECNQI